MRKPNRLSFIYRTHLIDYGFKLDLKGAMWRPKYYVFNIYSASKLKEKLTYMHANPVQAGLVDHAQDWRFSSARWYLLGKSVGVPITPLQ